MVKKQSSLEKRIKRLNKQIVAVNSDIKVLSKAAEKGVGIENIPRLKSEKQLRASSSGKDVASRDESPAANVGQSNHTHQHDGMESERVVQEQARKASQNPDGRLSDFLATNFQSVGPLRHERKKQRNKAIFVILIVVIVLLWMWMK